MMPPRKPLVIVKLSDNGGHYLLQLKCDHCGHQREARPEASAKIAGWEEQPAAVLEQFAALAAGRGVARRYRDAKLSATGRKYLIHSGNYFLGFSGRPLQE
jgi:hypothetical protein